VRGSNPRRSTIEFAATFGWLFLYASVAYRVVLPLSFPWLCAGGLLRVSQWDYNNVFMKGSERWINDSHC
ncbi:MAG: hypothetical protein RR362_02985, partial [Raoultibacter sp.]